MRRKFRTPDQPLSGCDGNTGAFGHVAHRSRIARLDRLFDEQRPARCDGADVIKCRSG